MSRAQPYNTSVKQIFKRWYQVLPLKKDVPTLLDVGTVQMVRVGVQTQCAFWFPAWLFVGKERKSVFTTVYVFTPPPWGPQYWYRPVSRWSSGPEARRPTGTALRWPPSAPVAKSRQVARRPGGLLARRSGGHLVPRWPSGPEARRPTGTAPRRPPSAPVAKWPGGMLLVAPSSWPAGAQAS